MRLLNTFIGLTAVGAIVGVASPCVAHAPRAVANAPLWLDDQGAPPPPPAQVGAGSDLISETPDQSGQDVTYFHDQLAPYGQWISSPDYGQVFQPSALPPDWRPYTLGHWVYTDDNGWMWVSDEPFGWATYHYGRWADDSSLGWVWVPGHTWAPAWVAWRNGNGVYGWAPLPPARQGGPVAIDVDHIDPRFFSFVDSRDLLDAHIHDRIHPVKENTTIINKTTNITHIENVQGRVVNRGVDVNEVEKASGKKVDHLKVAERKDAKAAEVEGDHVAVFRPTIPHRSAQSPEPQKASERQTPEAAPHDAHEEATHDGHDKPADGDGKREDGKHDGQ